METSYGAKIKAFHNIYAVTLSALKQRYAKNSQLI
jgi:hypothetical protein